MRNQRVRVLVETHVRESDVNECNNFNRDCGSVYDITAAIE